MSANPSVHVGYLDVVNGGSGSTTMPLASVPHWLARRPGLVIRTLEPVGTLEDSRVYRQHAREGNHILADNLVNKIS